MTYKEYMDKYGLCFGDENHDDGETMPRTLEELLEYLQDDEIICPDTVQGGVPVKITIDVKDAVEKIEYNLQEDDFAGEDYEMTEEGRAFLTKCFQEYNERYANNGYYCETVDVTVPDAMKYGLGEDE